MQRNIISFQNFKRSNLIRTKHLRLSLRGSLEISVPLTLQWDREKIYKKETFKTENSDSVQWRIQEFVHWGLRFFICGGGAEKNPLKTIDFSDTVGGP